MKESINNAKGNVADKMGLPVDAVLDIPQITVTGDNEITIENHKGIIVFEEDEIKIDSNVGIISVKGSNLEIIFIGGSTVILGGKFKSITYEGKVL